MMKAPEDEFSPWTWRESLGVMARSHMSIYHQVILGGKQEARWITKHRFIKHPLNLG